MTDALPRLSIVIVNYNTRALLAACLDSLHAHAPPATEVIVVDNASTDGSAASVAGQYPWVRLLAQPTNTWFCGGNNIGIAAARAPWVLLLNPDTTVTPGALAALLAFAEAHPQYSGATAQLVYPDGRVQRTCSRVPSLADLLLTQTVLALLLPWAARRATRHRFYQDVGWARDRDFDVEALPGSCTLARREALWLDDALRLYFPEEALARRLNTRARPFRYLAAARIVHHEKSSAHGWRAQRVYFDDLLAYARQQHGRAAAALLWLLSRPLLLLLWLRRA